MSDKTFRVRGIIPAIIFGNDESGRVSEKMLGRQIDYLLEAGVDGIFMNGTTGEGAVLATEEKAEVVRIAQRRVNGRVPLYGVCLQPSTDAVVREIKVMADLGVAAVSAVPPYYYAAPQEVIKAHFRRIADESPLPVVLYNIPQNTHSPMTVDTVLELAKHPNIVGIKDSSGDFPSFNKMLLLTDPESFACVQGEDMLDAAALLVGSPAVVTGLGNVLIEHYVEMYRSAQTGDRAKVMDFQRTIYSIAKIIAVSGGQVIPPIKAAAELLGRGNRRMRVEGLTLADRQVDAVRSVLKEVGAL